MKQTFNFLLMLVMVATVLSCKKSEPTPELTPAQKIVGKYTFTTATSSSGGVSRDLLANRTACQADDTIEFTADGKSIISEGATSCTSPAPTRTSAYALSADGKTLTNTSTNSSGIVNNEIYTVVELTGSVLKITRTVTDPTGGPNGTSITIKIDLGYTKI